MKKLWILLLAALLALPLAACGGGDGSDPAPAGPEAQADGSAPAPDAGSKFVFTYRGCPLPVNAPFAELLAFIGEPENYFEAESCAFEGLDKTYTYGEVEIVTYPDGDVDYISSVRLLTDAVATPEGITVGSTQEEVEAAYGTEYRTMGKQFLYEDGDAVLAVLFQDGRAVSVEYSAVNDLLG